MAYDQIFAERVRTLLKDQNGYSERKMFGGVCFMINGNMACCVVKDDLMLRLNQKLAEEVLANPDTRPLDFTGKTMKSMVYVNGEGTKSDADLGKWVEIAMKHAMSLPPKK